MTSTPTSAALSFRLALPTVVLYAAGYPIGSAVVGVMSPFLVIALRFALSAVALWVLVWLRRLTRPSRRQFLGACGAGLLTQAVQFLGLYWGLSHGVSSGLGSLIIALNPVMTALLLMVLFRRRESVNGAIALGLAAVSVVLACLPKLMADHHAGVAVIAVLIGMVGLSLGGIVQARHCQGMDAMMVGAIGLTASTPFAGIFALVTPQHVSNWPKAAVLLVVMVVVSSVGATTLYSQCIKRAGAPGASILFAVIPAVATVMGWVALGEKLTAPTVLALVLGASACALQSRSSVRA